MKRSSVIRRHDKGLRSLTQVSRQIRTEFIPLYLTIQFQHTYSTAASLKKFLQSILIALPKDSKIELVIVLKFSYPALEFLPIFKLIVATYQEGLKVSFQCGDWHITTAEIMNRAIQQKTLWQGSTSQVKRIECYRKPTVHLLSGSYWSWKDKDDRSKAYDVWRSLGFIVK
ncbi:uncharacterized protein EKO05_0005355 [Ascochyta rabiei]|uniref:uncharacterized protein n=1 Tax=Didymella rabiei TaxID=5454 RepID=UPI002204F8D4|nr:uncharacterized protein EKO05_0005355 [Ascochyta rabiei]UPX14884.1 hypothetical protein EKO05_0005355 [Ascochyta rabiei]